MRRNRILCLLIVIVMAALACGPAYALKASTLCRGSKGENVRLLQQALINLGYLSGKADGKFGPMTEEAVIRFQRANSLTADGLAGTKTLSLLLGGQSAPAVQAPAQQVSAPAGFVRCAAVSAEDPGSFPRFPPPFPRPGPCWREPT